MSKGFFDFHGHPMIKPFGRTVARMLRKRFPVSKEASEYSFFEQELLLLFKRLFQHWNRNPIRRGDNSSRFLNSHFAELAFVKYSQSNFTIATTAHGKVFNFSLYSIEKEFLSNNLKSK